MNNPMQALIGISEKVRRPIGAKIFGVTGVLLLMMAAVTYTSSTNLKQLNRQLGILSDYYIPLDQAIGDIRASHLTQLLLFERLISLQTLQPFAQAQQSAQPFIAKMLPCTQEKLWATAKGMREAFPVPAERTAVFYEMTRACADNQIETTLALVQSALALPSVRKDPEQIQKFTTLHAQLPFIAQARTNLHNNIGKYLNQVQNTDSQALAVLKEQLDESRRSVGRESGNLAKLLHGYTQEAAAKANLLEQQAFAFNWAVTLVAVVLGLIFTALLTRNLLKPIRELLSGARAIEQGDLSIQINVHSADELALLAQSFNYMVSGLKEKESIKATFGKYIDPRIVQNLLDERAFPKSGEKRVMSVFFSDIEGFTAIGEQLTPDGVVRLLNHYFSEMSEPIRSNKGIIDKYIGDAIMAFWGPPFVDAGEHALLACYAALDQMAQLEHFRATLPDVIGLRVGLPSFNVRMGISTGDVTVGSIGSETTKSYTVIGDTVNLASRLEAVNKRFGTRIIISEETWVAARDALETRELDRIRVQGKAEPSRVFELLGRKGQVPQPKLELRDAFERGLQAYRNREWAVAHQQFVACQALNPADAPSQLFLRRLQFFEEQPPAADWDGVWSFVEK